MLARHSMDIINEEHKNAVQFARLMSAFLGDDPAYRRSNMLSLPAYNHLDGLEDPSKPKPPTEAHGDTNGNTNGNANGSTNGTKIKGEEPPRRRPSTRNQTQQDIDPFFAAPQFQIDRDYGISAGEAEETRQLTQIAQQRSEEFIRCMTKVRYGLLRAERYQSKVLKWTQEMAGEEDDSDGMEQPTQSTPSSKK